MTERVPPSSARQRHRSPVLAAVLSFVVPGLGQVYAGRLVRGLLLAMPQTALLLILAWRLQDPVGLAGVLLVNAMALAMLNILLLIYRAYAVVDAYLLTSGSGGVNLSRRARASGALALVLLLLADVSLHGYAAYAGYVLDRSASLSFPTDCANLDPDAPRPRNCPRSGALLTQTPGSTPTPAPGRTASPEANPTLGPGGTTTVSPTPGAGATPPPRPAAVPTPVPDTPYWAENGRLDVLLLGSDHGDGRSGLRTDTMIVASIEIATGRAALFGIPRDVTNVPLPRSLTSEYSCHCFPYPRILNSLITYFNLGVVRFRDGDDDAFRALAETIEGVLRVELDGTVVVDLQGFVNAVDALGGVTIDVPRAVFEAEYHDENERVQRLDIEPGVQHMNGHRALAYARSREQGSDYGRMHRQQELLRAIQAQLTVCNVLPRLPALFEAIGDAVRTDIPREEVPGLIELVSRSKTPRRFEFTPWRGYPSDWGDPATLAKVRDAVEQGFAPKLGQIDPAEPEESLPPLPGNPC